MNKSRGVRPLLLLGLLLGLGSHVAAAASPPAPAVRGLNAASINPHLDLRPPQWCVLDMARDIAAGTALLRTFQAIVLQESSAGDFLENAQDPSYGAAGVKRETAESILGRATTSTELKGDTALNLRIGFTVLQQCARQFGVWRRVLTCYNGGPSYAKSRTHAQVDADDYVASITWRLAELDIYRKRTSKCPRD